MKKGIFVAIAILISATTFNSCSPLKSTKTVSTPNVSSQLLGQVGTLLIGDLGGMLKQSGMGNLASTLTMGTKLNSILKTAQLVSSFKSLLAGKYQLPTNLINNAYGSMNTLGDVAGFVAKNANPNLLSSLLK